MKLIQILEMASGNFGKRMWYHGTSKSAHDKILQSGVMIPSISDDTTHGKAIWFTSNVEEALSFGKYVFELRNDDVINFKNKKISPYPHGFKKKYGIGREEYYHMVVLEPIPLKYLNIHH